MTSQRPTRDEAAEAFRRAGIEPEEESISALLTIAEQAHLEKRAQGLCPACAGLGAFPQVCRACQGRGCGGCDRGLRAAAADCSLCNGTGRAG